MPFGLPQIFLLIQLNINSSYFKNINFEINYLYEILEILLDISVKIGEKGKKKNYLLLSIHHDKKK